jgi:hypothetical protein
MRRTIIAAVLAVCLFVGVFPGVALAKTTTISPAFIAKVNAYCTSEESQFNKVLGKFPFPNFDPTKPDVKTMKLVGKHFAKDLPLRRAIPNDLNKLGQPPVGKTQWAAIKALALQSNQVALTQIQAALAGNTKAFVNTVNQSDTVQTKLTATATKAGFSKKTPCGDVF